MSIKKSEVLEKEKRDLWGKPIVAKNEVFEVQQIEDFWNMFNLYADNRRQADVREIAATAKTLGFDKSHEFIYSALVGISEDLGGEWVNFERFLEMLTERIVHQKVYRVILIAKKGVDKHLP
jgi:Ca2+-binding EF-hand superfamily protein